MIRNEAFCPTTAVKMEKPPTQQLLYLVISKLVLYWILYSRKQKILPHFRNSV